MMDDRISGHLQALIAQYVREQLDFEFYRIERVEPDAGCSKSLTRYMARLTFWNSPERIDELVGKGAAADADTRRCFFSRDFKAILTIEGDKVVSTEWEGIQLS